MLRSEYALYLSDIGLSKDQLRAIRSALAISMREAPDPFSVGFDSGLNLVFQFLSGGLAEASEFEDDYSGLPAHVQVPEAPGEHALQLPAQWHWAAEQAEQLAGAVQSLARPTWHELACQAARAEAEPERLFWAGRASALTAVASAFWGQAQP
ncbi:hypothetical protein WDL1P1_00204 (plasmid) [Variovorax sp. WDL1]|nr:hypothetical protein CHC06_05788 [Variovorax sp. B2]PNG51038.1 hypothetical protein CHC07_05694 [Variovorax sp. B4]VTU42163.1 hypothetical protein SRS16P1_00205 [Variovorax sp. SRS16]VTU42195.1 hypothetical protein E5P1_00203 [Variovorax sp. PBL-E5]VTU44313.1 hypothetical protein H6P1_00728 [Variovorax sp. PBL-H6]VTV17211.1 hypothetical protein WDL1P1_00204 [Variovorax sp. WDL1]